VFLLSSLTLALLVGQGAMAAPATLNPKQIPQFVNPLPNPLDPAFIW
jgi:hypothetical protein